jgi:hypothetical protein
MSESNPERWQHKTKLSKFEERCTINLHSFRMRLYRSSNLLQKLLARFQISVPGALYLQIEGGGEKM